MVSHFGSRTEKFGSHYEELGVARAEIEELGWTTRPSKSKNPDLHPSTLYNSHQRVCGWCAQVQHIKPVHVLVFANSSAIAVFNWVSPNSDTALQRDTSKSFHL